jgi:hypothetical protein
MATAKHKTKTINTARKLGKGKPAKKSNASPPSKVSVSPPQSSSAKVTPASPQSRSSKPEAAGSSKQSIVLSMLRSAKGTTIAAIMTATGWQQHSVRGFFAGVVGKKLKFDLSSQKVGDQRIYRIGKAS